MIINKSELDKIRIDIHLEAIKKGRYELKLNEEEQKNLYDKMKKYFTETVKS
jgi:hypothetical protein